VSASSPTALAGVRRAPTQERSARRLSAVLEAAGALADERGHELVTTTDIARRAGISIGTLYRFFDDKPAVYRALALIHLEEFVARLEQRLATDQPASPEAAADLGVALYVEMRRTVPGFRGFGDVIDTHLIAGDRDNDTVLAERLLRVLAVHFDVEDSPRTRLVMLTAVTIADGVLRLAFRLSPEGDEAAVEQAAIAVRRYLGGQL
jgi:AcrR family transcriptional regulator